MVLTDSNAWTNAFLDASSRSSMCGYLIRFRSTFVTAIFTFRHISSAFAKSRLNASCWTRKLVSVAVLTDSSNDFHWSNLIRTCLISDSRALHEKTFHGSISNMFDFVKLKISQHRFERHMNLLSHSIKRIWSRHQGRFQITHLPITKYNQKY